MKFCSFLTCIILFCSCSNGHSKFVKAKEPAIRSIKASKKESIILVSFSDKDVAFYWNISTGSIVEDSLFKKLKRIYKRKRDYLIDQVSDTTRTTASVCHDLKRKLLMGDMAYLLLDKMENLPFFEITHIQCDVIENDCPSPVNCMDSGLDRPAIQKRIRHYLRSEKN